MTLRSTFLALMRFLFMVWIAGMPCPVSAELPVIEKSAGNAAIHLSVLGVYESHLFDESAIEISAYDPKNKQLFVVKATEAALDVLDLSDPTHPTLKGRIDLSRYGDAVNSVAVHGELVAVALGVTQDAETNLHAAGKVVIMDVGATVLNSVEVGVLPDMLTFTPDGSMLLVANEGEPNLGASRDPEGSISLIDLSAGPRDLTVTQLGFSAFNAKFHSLRNAGVRLYPYGSSVAQDLEPEYIAVSPDGTTAFVSLQENSAFAVIDLEKKAVADILPMGLKDWSRGQPSLTQFVFAELPPLPGQAADGDPIIKLGGFSSLCFAGVRDDGKYEFYTTPDRGPNKPLCESKGSQTIFPRPVYEHRIVKFVIDPQNPHAGAVVTGEILLKREDGITPVTALPNIKDWKGEQQPVDTTGTLLAEKYDPYGGDMEGIAVDKNGDFWLVDESRPSIYHFNDKGILISRLVPKGTAALGGDPEGSYGDELLPEAYLSRRTNRGFGAAAYDLEKNIVYAFLQSPMNNPSTDAVKGSATIRILGIDAASSRPVAEYVYFLENAAWCLNAVDKIGAAAYIGNDEFYVIEEDASTHERDGKKFLFRINLRYADNLVGKTPGDFGGKTLEQLSADEFALLGFKAANKIKVLNLPSIGYTPSDKAEGLAILPNGSLAVLNDNDFAYDYTKNVLIETPEILGLISFDTGNTVDVIKDNNVKLEHQPIYGSFMPDAIAAYAVDGNTYYLTANEGDDRDDWYEDTVLSDTVKLGSLTLDPISFPENTAASALQSVSDLRISSIDGDVNGDGKYEYLTAYGARSFSIWDAYGNLVFDSGDAAERITAETAAANFNCSNDDNSLEDRSEKKGPEAEGLTLGEIDGKMYAFIGLERIGGILVYDVSDPYEAEFVQYINRRNFDVDPEDGTIDGTAGDLGPEGLLFLSADDSPNGSPLLLVSNEVSGSLTVFSIATE
ncbi:calcium-binding protein [candidate division KSB3 bacterium]|uniref:Calcium-binding protein n=1 Tax=candidate division KSB3 bacterium TaxID=2044937 RepID=A0A2G6E3X6_9BACT|nr:MAG: calcium-binding protein [candidate division KSB3 bacterium]PIE29355.1 MAG: calcium-binding protein [candidate division KSB3 bacterium]